MLPTLIEIEQELKKRLAYPYRWGTKQTDELDKQTNFVYHTFEFEKLLDQIEKRFANLSDKEDIRNYTLNRWYNFHSAMAVEAIFKSHLKVKRTDRSKDKEKDFFIEDIPFDHKTTVFPKKYEATFNETVNQPKQLIEWLYQHQSIEGRQHFKNRLFIVLYHSEGEHWTLKAALQRMELVIHQYLNQFNAANLIELSFDKDETTLSDLIWVLG